MSFINYLNEENSEIKKLKKGDKISYYDNRGTDRLVKGEVIQNKKDFITIKTEMGNLLTYKHSDIELDK